MRYTSLRHKVILMLRCTLQKETDCEFSSSFVTLSQETNLWNWVIKMSYCLGVDVLLCLRIHSGSQAIKVLILYENIDQTLPNKLHGPMLLLLLLLLFCNFLCFPFLYSMHCKLQNTKHILMVYIIIVLLYENIDQILQNKLHGQMHYKIGVTCVYIGHMIYTRL